MIGCPLPGWRGKHRDPQKAAKLLQAQATHQPAAALLIAISYRDGYGVQKNESMYQSYANTAAAQTKCPGTRQAAQLLMKASRFELANGFIEHICDAPEVDLIFGTLVNSLN